MGRCGRTAVAVVFALLVVLFVSAGLVIWAAIGPDITQACDDPSLRPSDAGWELVATRHGEFSAEGSVNGSALEWHRTDGTARTLLLFRWKESPRGAFSEPLADVSLRGAPAAVLAVEGWPPGTPDGYGISWQEGLLGCTWFDLRLTGAAVTTSELVDIAEGLR